MTKYEELKMRYEESLVDKELDFSNINDIEECHKTRGLSHCLGCCHWNDCKNSKAKEEMAKQKDVNYILIKNDTGYRVVDIDHMRQKHTKDIYWVRKGKVVESNCEHIPVGVFMGYCMTSTTLNAVYKNINDIDTQTQLVDMGKCFEILRSASTVEGLFNIFDLVKYRNGQYSLYRDYNGKPIYKMYIDVKGNYMNYTTLENGKWSLKEEYKITYKPSDEEYKAMKKGEVH